MAGEISRCYHIVFQLDSIFNMRRPYDLMALLKQEQRAVMLENLKEELLARKEEIDRNEDKDTGRLSREYLFMAVFSLLLSKSLILHVMCNIPPYFKPRISNTVAALQTHGNLPVVLRATFTKNRVALTKCQ